MRRRTDGTLDRDCVLKATVQVCATCMEVSPLTTCMKLNTPPFTQIAPFDTRFASQTRKKARLPNQSVQAFRVSKRPPRLVYHHSLVIKIRVCSLFVILSVIGALGWAPKVFRQVERSVSILENSCCLLLLLCSSFLHCPCFVHCCHDPIIARTALNCFHLSSVFT